MRLGEGFYVPPAPVEVVHTPTFEELRNEQLLVAIAALQDALLSMPTPQVHVQAPDLTAIVQAVTGLKPGATSEDIASAVVRQISPTSQTDTGEVLSKVVAALEKLDFRMQAGTGGSVALASSDISDRASRQIGEVTVKNPTPATETGLAKEVTQQNIFAAVDTLEMLTGNLISATQALLTDSQLRASAVQVTPRDQTSTGTLTTSVPNSTQGVVSTSGVVVVPAAGESGFMAMVKGTFTGSVVTEGSPDGGVTWVPTAWRQSVTGSVGNTLQAARMVNDVALLRGSAGGFTHYRVRGQVLTGSAAVTLTTHLGTAAVFPNVFFETRSLFQYYTNVAGGNVSFNSTTSVINLAGSNTVAVNDSTSGIGVAMLRNPVGSLVDLHVAKIALGTEAAGIFYRLRNGTIQTVLGQTPQPAVNRGGGTNVASGEFFARVGTVTTTTFTGGTVGKLEFVQASSERADDIDGTIVLRPGQNIYWRFRAAANQTANISVEVAWWETAATV